MREFLFWVGVFFVIWAFVFFMLVRKKADSGDGDRGSKMKLTGVEPGEIERDQNHG